MVIDDPNAFTITPSPTAAPIVTTPNTGTYPFQIKPQPLPQPQLQPFFAPSGISYPLNFTLDGVELNTVAKLMRRILEMKDGAPDADKVAALQAILIAVPEFGK